MYLRRLLSIITILGIVSGLAEAASADWLDGNLQVVDLSDLSTPLPLQVNSSTQILWQTQDWEHSSYENPNWPDGGVDSLGYPSMVKNDHGLNPDGKYYLFYAHHDPVSGIGNAVADSITGPYIKISPTDSKVLTPPNYDPAGPNPGDPSHYSTPSVIWNEDEGLWFMYFHYYNHYYPGWSAGNNPGFGHQMTALATTPDLSSHNWTIWTDSAWSGESVWNIVPVMPTTDEAWMNSASSYNAVQRLPDGSWLAFMRGTNYETGMPTVGFAASADGRDWDYFNENPVIAPGKAWTVNSTEYRPKFIGYLGKNGSNENEYLVAWSEGSHPQIIYSTTTDFKTFERDPRGYAYWGIGDDGLVSAWREGNTLYLVSGKEVHEMDLSSNIIPSIPRESITVTASQSLTDLENLINGDLVNNVIPGGLAHIDVPTSSLDGVGVTSWLQSVGPSNSSPAVGSGVLGWAQFVFDDLYDIESLRIYNLADVDNHERSMRQTKIHYSTDGGTSWTELADFELQMTPGDNTGEGQIVPAGITANAVLVSGLSNWGAASNFVGLDEVVFNLSDAQGDFNGDSVVDGSDFLAWQRGESPNALSRSDLADWEANYGNSLAAASVERVPEPIGMILVGTALMLLFSCRN